MTAVAVWSHKPSAQELLKERLGRGWEPTPSGLQGGDQVLGYASCVFLAPGEARHGHVHQLPPPGGRNV